MENITKEMIEKAKGCNSVEELTALAKESGTELTAAEAQAYWEQLHPKTGALSDEELDNVAGGYCYKRGYRVVSVGDGCKHYECKSCRHHISEWNIFVSHPCRMANNQDVLNICNTCSYCSYEGDLWLCKNPENRK